MIMAYLKPKTPSMSPCRKCEGLGYQWFIAEAAAWGPVCKTCGGRGMVNNKNNKEGNGGAAGVSNT